MNGEELRAFLDRPFTAIIATINSNGAPHVVPVWYRYDGSTFTIWTDARRLWVRDAARRRDVSLAIAEHAEPFSAALVSGTASVATEAPGTDEEIRRISRRYMPEDEVEDYVATWAALRTIVRVTPARIRSWGRGY